MVLTTQSSSALCLRGRNVQIRRSSSLGDFLKVCQPLVCLKMISLKCLLMRLFKAFPFEARCGDCKTGSSEKNDSLKWGRCELWTTTVRTVAEIKSV